MSKKNISIIIRSYNEEKWIGACLEAIFKQAYKDFEVILIDNNSSDQTVKKAEKYPVKIIKIDKFLPGQAINIGIRASQGKYIVCLSAHCIPVNTEWLGNLLAIFSDDKVAGVYGRQEPMSFTSDTDKWDLLTVFGLDKKIQTKDSFFHNANSMIRRDIWDKIPFDEKITNIEDRLWAKEIVKAGYKLIYEPEASVYHHHGIHQNQNQERCTNVVKILENLGKEDGYEFQHLDLKELNVIAIIPVRGQVLKLNNKPLLEYSIASAKACPFIKKVIVSTDSKELAEIAKRAGAEVPFLRDPSLSKEDLDIEHVYQYTLKELEKKGVIADIIVTLESTFPFRPKGFIDQLILRLVKEGLDSVIAAKPEFRACWINNQGELKRVDAGFVPRKFKEPMYLGVQSLGCATHPIFLRAGHLLGEKVGIIEVNDPYSLVEVRDELGIHFAEKLIKDWKQSIGETKK